MSIEQEYQKISHNTIQGITKRLKYWKSKDGTIIKCSRDKQGFGQGWYRNYYYKGHSYFATADFLLCQFEGGAYWSFSNASLQEKRIEESIRNSRDAELHRKAYYTGRSKAYNEYFNTPATKRLDDSFSWGGFIEAGNMHDEIKAHLYHQSLEYLFKAIWLHSKRKSGASFQELYNQKVNNKRNPIRTHNLFEIFTMWDKNLQKEIEKSFNIAVEQFTNATVKDTLINLLQEGGDREIDTNRYNKEIYYPIRIVRILQDLAEFFFLHLFNSQKIETPTTSQNKKSP